MSENISVTRISDLPEGPYVSRPSSGGGSSGFPDQGLSNTYMPIDPHPNPFGIPPPPPGGMLPPEQTQRVRENNAPMYSPNEFADMVQRLPQRDIPMNPLQHIHDERVQPNYIPQPKLTSDYIRDYQDTSDRQIREHEERRNREKIRETWLDEAQIPILVGLLYFVFQLPIVNTLIFKRFSFLSIYGDDGNFNLTGLVLKCVLFGISFYSLHKFIEIVGNM